jgi:hypothetical protein
MATYSNLIIDQGSDFTFSVELDNLTGGDANIAGYTGAGRIRKHYESSPASASFSIKGSVSNSPTFSSSDTGVTAVLSAVQTSSLKSGRYVYDIEIRNSPAVIRVLEGQIEVTPRVTRSTET